MINLDRHVLRETYNSWHEKNRASVLNGSWELIDKKVLAQPELDMEKGINIISYLNKKTNRWIDEEVIAPLKNVVGDSGWFIPSSERHVTVLDVVLHNAGVDLPELRRISKDYKKVVDRAVDSLSSKKVEVGFSGVFTSPNGITLQGFPIGDGLAVLRNSLRQTIEASGLLNQEMEKYYIVSAHVSLIKFIKPLDGVGLLEVIDSMRTTKPPIVAHLDRMVLNISNRFDKAKTLEVVERWEI